MADNKREVREKPRESGWISAEAAGTMEGISRRAIQKKIQAGKYPSDKICQVENGHGKRWEIHVSALSLAAQSSYWKRHTEAELDAAVSEIVNIQESPGPAAPELATLVRANTKEREEALRRQRLVEEFRQLSGKPARRKFAHYRHLCLATLYNWQKRYDGTAASLLQPRGYARRREENDIQKEALYLYNSPTRPSIYQVWLALREKYKEDAPGRSTLYRWLSPENLNIPESTYMRDGLQVYRDKCEPIRRRDWSLIPVNHTWVGDHHEYDLLVVMPDNTIGRLWLTAWMDGRSRAITGWTTNARPNSLEIGRALRNGIMPKDGSPIQGIPKQLYVDNGKDYRSKLLNGNTIPVFRQTQEDPIWGLLGFLGIGTRFCTPYQGRSKPIERFFGTLERGWVALLPGYCGNKPSARPADLEGDVKATQLYLKTDGARGECRLMTSWEAAEEFAIIINEYNRRPHRSLQGRTPLDVYSSGIPASVRIPARETIELLILPSAIRKVHPDGIYLTVYTGQQMTFWHPALVPLIRRKVEIRYEPGSLDDIIVIHNGELVCRARRQRPIAPFAEGEDEVADLQNWIRGTAELRKSYRERRQIMLRERQSMMDAMRPELRPAPRLVTPETTKHITGYDKAARQAAKADRPPTPAQESAVNEIIMWDFQRRRRENDPDGPR